MSRAALAPLLVLLAAAPAAAGRKAPAPTSEERIEQGSVQLLGRALSSDRAWDDLEHLCDRIGHRLSGSAALDRAIAWMRGRLEEGGVPATLEPVRVPRWVRGEERATLLEPTERDLPILGLGMTVGTPPEGVEAEVLVVGSWDDLEARSERVAGRIVLFDVPFTTYGETVQYRGRGASEAARRGAVAALVRSVSPISLSTPHTGALRYADDAPRIPAAALTIEDAEALHRLQDRGVTPRLRLTLGAEHRGEVDSANVVGTIRGREVPDEVVLLACHLDSWDVGQGAQDDGAGCAMILEAIRLLAELPWAPRRTVRAVFFTNEENGLAGAEAYLAAHGGEIHAAAIEADTGAGAALGWRLDVRGPAATLEQEQAAVEALLQPLLRRLAPLGAGSVRRSYAGADIGPLVEGGVLGLGVDFDTTGYWPVHHTAADTLDKIDPALLQRNVAVVALSALYLAETPVRLRPAVTP